MNRSGRQMSETFFLGALLTVTGGFLDAYTYLSRGGVFANAQTGNIVLLGIKLARGEFDALLHYLIPIAAFALGVVVAELVRHRFLRRPGIHWRQIVVAAEIGILLLAAFLPLGRWDTLVNVLISFLCAMQVEAFRKISGNACATTMCTGNLRSGTELLFHAVRDRDAAAWRRGLQYYAIILLFILGAVLGAWCTNLMQGKAILVCCGTLAVVFVAMFLKAEEKGAAV